MRIITSNNVLTAERPTLEELEARLNLGEAMINQCRAASQSVEALEEHWLHLLRQYEDEFRSMQEAA